VSGPSIVVMLGVGATRLDEVVAALGDASETGSSVVVLADDLIVVEEALGPIESDPTAPTSALVAKDPHGDVAVQHHRIVSAGTTFHEVRDPTHRSVGALVIAPDDCKSAREAIVGLHEALESGAIALESRELVEAMIVALVRGQIGVRAVEIVDVPWFRAPKDPDAAQSRVSAVSRERVQGLLANRVDDGFYSTFVVRKASKPLTRLALRMGASPNSITGISLLIGLAAAVMFASGEWIWIALGAIALQVSLIVDCVDGEVARATRKFTALGAWLDAATDRVKEFAAYGGLAIGASRMGMDVWWIAITLVVLQTTRHVSDYDFARIQRLREAHVPAVDIRERGDGRTQASGSLAVAMQTSARINRRSAVRWTKKVVHMPIGERWLLLSVLAIVAGPAWALGGLLIAGVVALGYVVVGRIARTLTWSGATPGEGGQVLRDQLDAGPIASGVARVLPALRPDMTGRFSWSVPVVLRAVELAVIAVLITSGGAANLAIAFWIVFVIAYHHYDNLYRSLQGARPPRWLTWIGFGWDGRILVITVLEVTALWEPSLAIVLGWWVLWFAGVASIQWLRSDR